MVIVRTIALDPEDESYLKERAKQDGVSISAVVRAALHRMRGGEK